MLKKIIIMVFLINITLIYSNQDFIFKKFNNYELVYLEKRPYGVYEFYSENISVYGKYLEKEGKYYYYKFENQTDKIIENREIFEYYNNIVNEYKGEIHYKDDNGITFNIKNFWVYINIGNKNYDIVAIELEKTLNEFFTYHEIKKELINNGKIVLSLIEFENENLKLDSSNQLIELLKFFNQFEGIKVKMCYYDDEDKGSNYEKGKILQEYFEIFGVNSENIILIKKDNINKINGLVLFY